MRLRGILIALSYFFCFFFFSFVPSLIFFFGFSFVFFSFVRFLSKTLYIFYRIPVCSMHLIFVA